MQNINAQQLHKYLLSYFEEDETETAVSDKNMRTQDIKTGKENKESTAVELSAPLIYSYIAKALYKADVASKKCLAILQDVGEMNDDQISEELAKEIMRNASGEKQDDEDED